MNPLSRAHRLIAAVASVTITAVLFSTVVSIAEPQRSTLIAKQAGQLQPVAARAGRATLQVAVAR